MQVLDEPEIILTQKGVHVSGFSEQEQYNHNNVCFSMYFPDMNTVSVPLQSLGETGGLRVKTGQI